MIIELDNHSTAGMGGAFEGDDGHAVCEACAGSGEGGYDGSTCRTCGGIGEAYDGAQEWDDPRVAAVYDDE